MAAESERARGGVACADTRSLRVCHVDDSALGIDVSALQCVGQGLRRFVCNPHPAAPYPLCILLSRSLYPISHLVSYLFKMGIFSGWFKKVRTITSCPVPGALC